METQVRTPQSVFMMPQRLVVPLFQRPYVWNRENQWEPLWDDVTRVAERKLAKPSDGHQEIFETLNARGAQLTAADLIKNFIFQRLVESDAAENARGSPRCGGRSRSAS